MIQSIQRAANLLTLFSFNKPLLRASEISKALGIHKATVNGIIKTLIQEGFLKRTPRGREATTMAYHTLGFQPGEKTSQQQLF